MICGSRSAVGDQFFLPRVGPAPRKAGIPDRRFRIDGKWRRPFAEPAFCISGWQPVSQAPPSGCVRFGGMEPGPLQDAMRGAVIRFGLGSDVPDTGLLLRPGAQCPDGFGHVTLFFKGFSSP